MKHESTITVPPIPKCHVNHSNTPIKYRFLKHQLEDQPFLPRLLLEKQVPQQQAQTLYQLWHLLESSHSVFPTLLFSSSHPSPSSLARLPRIHRISSASLLRRSCQAPFVTHLH